MTLKRLVKLPREAKMVIFVFQGLKLSNNDNNNNIQNSAPPSGHEEIRK